MKPTITYCYRGDVERGTATPRNPRPGYRWADGYSEDGPEGRPSYPWMTRRECQKDAKARGCRAVFVRGEA